MAFSRLSKDRRVEAEQNQRWFLPGFSASGKDLFKIVEVELIYNVVLASGAQQRNSVIYYCSVAKSCPTLCDPMDCSTPGFPVLYYLLEFAQIHVH